MADWQARDFGGRGGRGTRLDHYRPDAGVAGRLAEEVANRQGEARDHLAAVEGVGLVEQKRRLAEGKDLHRPAPGLDEPKQRYAGALVELVLLADFLVAVTGRHDLDG